MTLIQFAQWVARNGDPTRPVGNHIEVTATSAPDLPTGLHWIIEWTAFDGSRRREWAQDLDVLVHLAAETEAKIRQGG